jgi:putative tricarboxylic transport membrane protein
VLPGIGPAAGIGLLLPATFGMNPTSAVIMLAGMYYGAAYGGSTTAILINTPGESAAIMTTLDGYQMAKNGRAGAALAIAAIGSFIAGTLGTVALTFFALQVVKFALLFGPAEYFCLMLFSLSAITSLTGKSLPKGMISLILGLMIATIGIDWQTAQTRYGMGIDELEEGINFIVVTIGLFAMGEVFENIEDIMGGTLNPIKIKGRIWLTMEEWRRSIIPILRGGLIGFFVGLLPGAGGTVASIISYTTEKKYAKNPDMFGKGAIEGVAGPESANNSCAAAAFVPMLTLGVPGSVTSAMIMGALIMYGIQPGPLLFQKHPDLVWGLISSMYVGNVMLLILNMPMVGLFARILYIPSSILMPLIIAIAAAGAYTLRGNVFDIYMALLFGVIGYAFRKVEIPAAPLVLAVVLGKPMEQSFRQAMTISGADPIIFISSATSITLIILTLISISVSYIRSRKKKTNA